MRIVVFTGLADIEHTPWWSILLAAPDATGILVCQQIQVLTPRQILRRFRRNVARHGLLFVPYRIGVLVVQLTRRSLARPQALIPPSAVVVEEIVAPDLHANDIRERVGAFAPDLGVSIGAPILRPELFRLPRRGTINLHLGKLPEFRGAPPAFWELVHDAPSIGATVHWMDETLDTGAVISEGVAPLYTDDSLHEAETRVIELGTHVLTRALRALAAGEPVSKSQPQQGARTHRSPTLGGRLALGRRTLARRLRRRLAPRRIVKDAALLTLLYVYRPLRDLVRTMGRRHPVRIFTFHRVTCLCRDPMTVSPEQFREQIDYLEKHHDVVSLERGIAAIRTGARLSRPLAVLTFDDAYRSVATAAWPILSKRRMPATCFVSTNYVGTAVRFQHDAGSLVRDYLDVMSWSELACLCADGWSVGTHTKNHVRLASCPSAELASEVEEPRQTLRERLGAEATVLAYPFGGPDDISAQALEAARAAGHTTVLANHDGENWPGTMSLSLGRFDIGGDRAPLSWKSLAHGLDLASWRQLWPA